MRTRFCLLSLALSASVAGACYGLQEYSCTSDENCVDGAKQGICEATGFCSYPDTECDSGQRYDDLAGGLAGSCVDDGPTMTLGSSGSSPTSASTSTGGGESSGSDSSTGELGCEDADGDGYGEGSGCLDSDCDDDNPAAAQNCLYIASNGDDAAAGDADAPWRTFAHAVSMLAPGTTLVVLPGTYTPDDHGALVVDCDEAPNLNGTPQAPVFVRAFQERAAHLQTDGDRSGIEITNCTDWNIRGLRISGADNSEGAGSSLVSLRNSQRLVFRRLLAHTANRFSNSPIFFLSECTDTLIEESEAYDFSGSGFWTPDSANTTLRRVYAHSRDRADLPGCTTPASRGVPGCTSYGTRGDSGVKMGDGTTVENAVIEHAALGVVGNPTVDAAVLGSAMVGGLHAVIFSTNSEGDAFTQGVLVEDVVGVGLEGNVAFMRSVQDVTLRNLTAVGGSAALRADVFSDHLCPGACVTNATSLLAVQSAGTAISMLNDNGGAVTYSNAFGSTNTEYLPQTEPIDDDEGLFRQSLSVATPRIGTDADQCIAYIPADSVMSGAGADGADIGANIVYRTVDRTLTDALLWDAETGAFPCGAVVEGVNDDPETSCVGVHARLHIGTSDCPLP